MQDASVHGSAFCCITRVNMFNSSIRKHALQVDFTSQVSISNGFVFCQLTWLPLHSFNSVLREGSLSFCIAVLLLLQQPTQSLANFLKWTSVHVTGFRAFTGSVLQVSFLKILSLSVSVSHFRRASLMITPAYQAFAGFATLTNTFLKALSSSPSHQGPPVFRDFEKMQCGVAAVLSLHFRWTTHCISSTLSFFSRVCFTRSVKYWPIDDSQSQTSPPSTSAVNFCWIKSLMTSATLFTVALESSS